MKIIKYIKKQVYKTNRAVAAAAYVRNKE